MPNSKVFSPSYPVKKVSTSGSRAITFDCEVGIGCLYFDNNYLFLFCFLQEPDNNIPLANKPKPGNIRGSGTDFATTTKVSNLLSNVYNI